MSASLKGYISGEGSLTPLTQIAQLGLAPVLVKRGSASNLLFARGGGPCRLNMITWRQFRGEVEL
jgi:hypothetical protein